MRSPRTRGATVRLLVGISAAALAAGALAGSTLAAGPSSSGGVDQPSPLPITHQPFNFYSGMDPVDAGGVGVSSFKNVTGTICSTTSSTSANVNTDCEGLAPHNETAIAVDPTDPNHLLASANDYQLRLSPGGTVYETIFSRAHVSFDGGETWTTSGVPFKSYVATGDPAVAFDANGTAYLSTLGFLFSQGRSPTGVNPDVLVSHSTDGGMTWSKPSRVASGSGSFGSVGTFNDKPFMTAWGDGNAIVTWTQFNDGIGGSYISSPIYASVTHDGGNTWSAPQEISGSADFCIGALTSAPNACDQDQGSTPVVAADGSIYVAFENYNAPATDLTGNDQYLVVKVDPQTGARIAGPYKVADLVDSVSDYPVNIDGRETYQDSQFRTWSVGNIAADPTNAAHLAVVWSDMRNSTLPANPDPYQATTNSDVVVSQSFDGGAAWSAPAALTLSGDQFMPWGAYDASGSLNIGFFDRSYDSSNHAYGYTLATETSAGSLTFTYAQMTTALTDPTQGTRWFSGRTPNQDFPHPTTFLGDYSGIAASPAGGIVALWTDGRNTADFAGRSGSGEDAYFAAAP